MANFLDYDYVERMGLKEGSIFVNRELNRELMMGSKITRELSNKKSKHQQQQQQQQQQIFMAHTQYYNDDAVGPDPMMDDNEHVAHSQTQTQMPPQLQKSCTQLLSMSKSRFDNCDVA